MLSSYVCAYTDVYKWSGVWFLKIASRNTIHSTNCMSELFVNVFPVRPFSKRSPLLGWLLSPSADRKIARFPLRMFSARRWYLIHELCVEQWKVFCVIRPMDLFTIFCVSYGETFTPYLVPWAYMSIINQLAELWRLSKYLRSPTSSRHTIWSQHKWRLNDMWGVSAKQLNNWHQRFALHLRNVLHTICATSYQWILYSWLRSNSKPFALWTSIFTMIRLRFNGY